MRIFPAIDLFEGHTVRLTEGDFTRRSYYDISPLDAAKQFKDSGCRDIHIVDLEGAKKGSPCNLKILEQIAALGLFIQYGGGLRSESSVQSALNSGADRVMIGSLIFKDPKRAPYIAETFKETAMPAIDIKNGKVAHSGWLEQTDITAEEAVDKLSACGFSAFLVTDTERDGKMSGSSAELYKKLIGEGREIVAAGGITKVRDIEEMALAKVGGAVIGKSLYEGGITLEEALAAGGRYR